MTQTPEATGTGDGRATYREVLAVAEFRALFVARTVTVAAITLRMLAVSVLVLAATGSPLVAGVAFGIGFLPQVLGGATLISLADRLRSRPALASGSVLEAGATLVMALAPGTPWLLLALVAVVATVTPVFGAAASGLVPSLLTGDRYVLGRSLFVLSSSAAQVAGLGLGGVVLALLAPRQVLLVAAAGHLVAAVAALRLADRPPRLVERAAGIRATLRTTLRATARGNRALVADRRIRGQLLAQVLPPALLTGVEGQVVAYVAQVHGPPSAVGFLLACAPVGMALGSLAVGRLCPPSARERLVVPLLCVVAAPTLLMLVEPALPLAGGLLLLASAGLAYELGLQQRFLDVTPEAARGQAFGLLSTLVMFGQGVGPAAAGALASLWSPSVAMAASGAAVLVTTVALRPHLRLRPPAQT